MGQNLDTNLRQLRDISDQLIDFKKAMKDNVDAHNYVSIYKFDIGPELHVQAKKHFDKEVEIFAHAILNLLETEQKRLLAEISNQILEPSKSELNNE